MAFFCLENETFSEFPEGKSRFAESDVLETTAFQIKVYISMTEKGDGNVYKPKAAKLVVKPIKTLDENSPDSSLHFHKY